MAEAAFDQHPNADFLARARSWVHDAPLSEALDFYEDLLADEQCDNWTIARLAEVDRYFLMIVVMERYDMIHQWSYARCREVEADPDGYLDVWAREHGKSSIQTIAGNLQDIVNDPEITIGIFSHTRDIAADFVWQIKQELEANAKWHELWPEIFWRNPKREAPRWGVYTGLVVKRKRQTKEATVEGWGLVDGMPTGRHFAKLVYDDVVTERSVTTPEMMQKTMDRFELSLSLGQQRTGRMQVIGTRYAFGDAYATMKERGTVKPREYPATDDGKPDGNPVLFTQQEWEKVKRDRGTYVLACQYLLNPIEGSKQVFRLEWLRPYELRPKTMNVYILVDPARSKKKSSDRTAIAAVGVDALRNRYLIDGVCHRMNLSERWQAAYRMRQKWKRAPGVQSVKVGWEKYGAEADLDYIHEQMKKPNIEAFPIHELTWLRDAPDSHQDRVQRLQPEFEQWSWFIPYSGVSDYSDGAMHPSSFAMTRAQREACERGQGYLVAEPIRAVNEDGVAYDVVQWWIDNEYVLFPAVHVDFFDAMSRFFDIDPTTPHITQAGEPEPDVTADY